MLDLLNPLAIRSFKYPSLSVPTSMFKPPTPMIGFVKPVLLDPWKGHRMVLSVYLGMRYVTGSGVLAFPVNPDANGHREVIRGHSFRA